MKRIDNKRYHAACSVHLKSKTGYSQAICRHTRGCGHVTDGDGDPYWVCGGLLDREEKIERPVKDSKAAHDRIIYTFLRFMSQLYWFFSLRYRRSLSTCVCLVLPKLLSLDSSISPILLPFFSHRPFRPSNDLASSFSPAFKPSDCSIRDIVRRKP